MLTYVSRKQKIEIEVGKHVTLFITRNVGTCTLPFIKAYLKFVG